MLLKFLDKKFTAKENKDYLFTYVFIGSPIGYIFVQLILMLMDWEKYDFSFGNMTFTLFFNLVFVIPFFINYIKHKKKYKQFLKKFNDDNLNKIKVIYDYKNYKKGEIYTIEKEYINSNLAWNIFEYKQTEALVIDEKVGYGIVLGNIINKFELVDIKEERLRKLKRLKSFW